VTDSHALAPRSPKPKPFSNYHMRNMNYSRILSTKRRKGSSYELNMDPTPKLCIVRLNPQVT
jgi:hypothetical protein